MMVCPEGGNAREAKTFYKVPNGFLIGFLIAFVELYPSTGRTHQLRVHMQFIGTPILADKLYTGQTEFRRSDVLGSSYKGVDDEILLGRQALHAFRSQFGTR